MDELVRVAVLTVAPSRRVLLRKHVHEAHEQLDHMIGNIETKQDYHRYLTSIAAFRLAAEASLARQDYPAWFQGWRPVSVTQALTQDLDKLGLVPPSMPPFMLPATISGLLGMLYTLEGSALGARLIARRASALGFDAAHGARHLDEQTAAPENWRGFLALLEQAPAFDVDEAGQAASRLFRYASDAVTLVDRTEEDAHG